MSGSPIGQRLLNVTIRGVTYADSVEAAEAMGVSRQRVTEAARTGRLDCVGLGRNHGTNRGPRKIVMCVSVRGVIYPSVKAVADEFKISTAMVYRAVANAKTDDIGLVFRRPRGNMKPLTICGRLFRSRMELSEFLGKQFNYATAMFQHGEEYAMRRLTKEYQARMVKNEQEN